MQETARDAEVNGYRSLKAEAVAASGRCQRDGTGIPPRVELGLLESWQKEKDVSLHPERMYPGNVPRLVSLLDLQDPKAKKLNDPIL